MKKIACVIVNYNDSQRTLKLIKKIDCFSSINHIIVVDNCSTDDSYPKLEKFESEKFHLIKPQKNGGYGYGNNFGAVKAKELGSDYILIANPDVDFSDECVQHMAQIMNKFSKCAVVGAKEIKMGVYAWRYTSAIDDILSASLIFNKLLKKRYYEKKYFANKDYVEVDLVPGCFLLIDLLKFFEVGGYDESIFLYEEEKILFCRLKKKYISLIDLNAEYAHNHVESHSYALNAILVGKKRLLTSRYVFLKKYRKLNPIMLIGAKLFFKITLFEMLVWGIVRKMLFCKQSRI